MLQKITQGVYALEQEELTDRPYLYYVRGEHRSLAVDAGNSPAHVEKFYAAIQAQGLPLPDMTVLTHWHWDHTFGLHAIHGTSIASNLTNEKLRQVSLWSWTEEAMAQREAEGLDIPFCHHCMRIEYGDISCICVQPADMALAAEGELDLGGVSCRLIPHDTPHSRDALLVYLPQEQVLFTGDSSGVDFYDNNARYDPARLRAWIDYLESLPLGWILSGHRPPQSKASELQWLKNKLAAL